MNQSTRACGTFSSALTARYASNTSTTVPVGTTCAFISSTRKRVSPRIAIGAWSSSACSSSWLAELTMRAPSSRSKALRSPASVPYTIVFV